MHSAVFAACNTYFNDIHRSQKLCCDYCVDKTKPVYIYEWVKALNVDFKSTQYAQQTLVMVMSWVELFTGITVFYAPFCRRTFSAAWMAKMVGWRYALLVGGLVGSVALCMYPIAIDPYFRPEKWSKSIVLLSMFAVWTVPWLNPLKCSGVG